MRVAILAILPVLSIVLNFCFWFILSTYEKDMSVSGAYAAAFIITSPIVFFLTVFFIVIYIHLLVILR